MISSAVAGRGTGIECTCLHYVMCGLTSYKLKFSNSLNVAWGSGEQSGIHLNKLKRELIMYSEHVIYCLF